ncbi:MAG: MraY family glycosyltransferase [Limnochordia bacterium]|jgi:UDP-GlcNAc:undecaprenyl-phosphate GlcNAc-1-phosphate transferase
MSSFVTAALLAVALSYALTVLVRELALIIGFVECPNERRIHLKPMPIGGGVAIYGAFWLTVLFSLNRFVPRVPEGFLSLFWGSTVIVVIGLLDDRLELRPWAKFVGQVAAAVLVVLYGHRIEFITDPFRGGMLYLGSWGFPLTVFWIVAITNMVNFIDGLDGLAAGVSAIACVPLALVSMQLNRPSIALLTLILLGSIGGFLPHNFNPARIFMGDAGAMFLGFMLSVIAVDGALKGAATIALTVPILALGVPVFDVLFAVIRRVAAGRPFYEADQGHLHHRLLALGLTQRQAVLALYTVSGLLGLGAVWSLGLKDWEGIAVFVVIVVCAMVVGQRVGVLPSPYQRAWADNEYGQRASGDDRGD